MGNVGKMRTVYIKKNGYVVIFAVNPEEIEMTYPNEVRTYNLQHGGYAAPPAPALMSLTLSSFLPHNGSQFGKMGKYRAAKAWSLMEFWRNGKEPVWVVIGGGHLRQLMYIKSLKRRIYENDKDIHFDIEFVEYCQPGDRLKARTYKPPEVYHHIKKGDRLSTLAKKYNVAGGWKALYNANKKAIGNKPSKLKVGTKIRIPLA